MLVVGTNCYSQDVRLHAECPQRGVTAENRNVLATDNTGVPRKYYNNKPTKHANLLIINQFGIM